MTLLQPLKNSLKSARQWVRYQGLPSAQPGGTTSSGGPETCVVTPDDPGSLGDLAMLRAISDRYGAAALDVSCWKYPEGRQFPYTRSKFDVQRLRGSRAEAMLAEYGRFCCVGADVMDGLYSYADSCLRLRLLGLAAAMGLESRLFGFSFNATPHPKAALEFRRLHRDVVVCVRDPLSHRRLGAVTDHPLRLVADLAFLVQAVDPSPAVQPMLEWIESQRRDGRRVIGLNVHPLLSLKHGSGTTQALIDSFVHLTEHASDHSFVLVPHDFRPTFGDMSTLEAIDRALPSAVRERVRFVKGIEDPAELKGFVAHLDGVLTGRMHLAIAALGKAVPVAGVTYQGKFEGLLQHFSLEGGLTISPPEAADPTKLLSFFRQWSTQLDRESATIREHLPRVTELSRLNFA